MTRLQPMLELLEAIPSAGRLRVLDTISVAGELGPLGVHHAGASPTLGMASYHVRELLKAGLVELVRTEPRRGAVAHFYSVTPAGLAVLDRVDTFAVAAGLTLEEATS